MIRIPGRLPGLNEYTKACRGSKFSGNRLKRITEDYICQCIKASQEPPVDDTGYPIRVRTVWIEPNSKRDVDNIVFAKKFIFDALVRSGVIVNDSQRFIRYTVDEVHTTGETGDDAHIEVYLEPMNKEGVKNGKEDNRITPEKREEAPHGSLQRSRQQHNGDSNPSDRAGGVHEMPA